jgi:DNA-3-methyladenine glycosylase II
MKNNDMQLDYTGDFSLALSVSSAKKASFIDGIYSGNNELDVAILIEGCWKTIGVRLKQQDKKVFAQIFANPDQATNQEIKQQLERMFSLNTDADGFAEIIAGDKVIENIYNSNQGLRPVLFPSAYEAAARAIIGHQLPVKQAAKIKERICEEHGVKVETEDQIMYAFPSPKKLEKLPYINGLAARKVEQLRILGAKTDTWLASISLLKMDKEEAMIALQKLPGIGPFSAELIMLRGAGDADSFPNTEMRLHRAMAQAYQLDENPDLKILRDIAESWRPFRTWAGLLLRDSIPW